MRCGCFSHACLYFAELLRPDAAAANTRRPSLIENADPVFDDTDSDVSFDDITGLCIDGDLAPQSIRLFHDDALRLQDKAAKQKQAKPGHTNMIGRPVSDCLVVWLSLRTAPSFACVAHRRATR